ncbi:sensor histidine kinase [Azospirillum thermophilum]|uniref:histidine kinase n=1 Tax=Azospirillum thermophilum TaxID=2202148 RepID=A0A2S2CTF6_9PROT|nr:histidine kinase dimerization/phosphoacceptor domain -containing protein [Azospirillum thermophilum]AWK87794.1 hypothetical protein DEW08_17795 [Azospirillum thermophilum]
MDMPPPDQPETPAKAESWRVRRFPNLEASIGWLAACGLVFLVMVTAVFAVQSRERALSAAEERAGAAVRVLAEHAARLFDAADLLVEFAVQETVGRDWAEIESSRPLWERLNRQRSRLPFLDAVWLNDETGTLRLSTVGFPTPPSNASDRDSFRALKAGSTLPFIGERIIGRVTGKPSFLLSRRLSHPDGSFRGMASVTIDPTYLSGFYKEMDFPYPADILMVRAGGFDVLVREPGRGAVPAPLPEPARLAMVQAPRGGVVHQDGALIAYRPVDNWPVFVAVQHELEPVTGTWRRLLAPYGVLAGAAALALLALSALGFRQARTARRQQEVLEDRVRERTASLRQALAERDEALGKKDLLVREVHHRVKNSLQVVSSLLTLHGQTVGDAALRAQLEEAGRRVQAISDIHQLLYRADDVRVIPFHDYLAALCRELERSALCRGQSWHLDLSVDPVEMPTDQAIPLGLIANELVMNALKHGYPQEGGAGNGAKPILVRMTRVGGHAVRLAVADRGVGLPEGFDWRRSRSLGMRLVHALSGQLGTRLEIERLNPGVRFAVEVTLEPPDDGPDDGPDDAPEDGPARPPSPPSPQSPGPPEARSGTSTRPTEQRSAGSPQ